MPHWKLVFQKGHFVNNLLGPFEGPFLVVK